LEEEEEERKKKKAEEEREQEIAALEAEELGRQLEEEARERRRKREEAERSEAEMNLGEGETKLEVQEIQDQAHNAPMEETKEKDVLEEKEGNEVEDESHNQKDPQIDLPPEPAGLSEISNEEQHNQSEVSERQTETGADQVAEEATGPVPTEEQNEAMEKEEGLVETNGERRTDETKALEAIPVIIEKEYLLLKNKDGEKQEEKEEENKEGEIKDASEAKRYDRSSMSSIRHISQSMDNIPGGINYNTSSYWKVPINTLDEGDMEDDEKKNEHNGLKETPVPVKELFQWEKRLKLKEEELNEVTRREILVSQKEKELEQEKVRLREWEDRLKLLSKSLEEKKGSISSSIGHFASILREHDTKEEKKEGNESIMQTENVNNGEGS